MSEKFNLADYYRYELSFIENDVIRSITERFIRSAPDYFRYIESASTKYHENFDGNYNKLKSHVKAAARFFILMKSHPMAKERIDPTSSDYILAALLVHDLMKRGTKEKPSDSNAFLSPIMLAGIMSKIELNPDEQAPIEYILSLVASQKGPWNTSPRSNEPLPQPSSLNHWIVHFCDWMASRYVTSIDVSDNQRTLDYLKDGWK